jgi:hypothetical protein
MRADPFFAIPQQTTVFVGLTTAGSWHGSRSDQPI